MKNYYIFPTKGSAVKISQEPDGQIVFQVEGEYRPRFKRENLISQLKALIEHIEKYG